MSSLPDPSSTSDYWLTDPLLIHDPVLKLLQPHQPVIPSSTREDVIPGGVANFIVSLDGHVTSVTSALHLVYEVMSRHVIVM